MFRKSSEGKVSLPLLIAAVGVIGFFMISSTVSFKDSFFSQFFFKPKSFASTIDTLPKVVLNIENKQALNGVINITPADLPLTLTWSVTNNAKQCFGEAYGVSDIDGGWIGVKSPQGGSFQIENLEKNNPYVYSINCSNDQGDSKGASITVNLNPQINFIKPSITGMEVYDDSNKSLDTSGPIQVDLNKKLNLVWSSINTNTPYSICVSTGSWKQSFNGLNNSGVIQQITLDSEKIHQFNLYCSNEYGSDEKTITFIPE